MSPVFFTFNDRSAPSAWSRQSLVHACIPPGFALRSCGRLAQGWENCSAISSSTCLPPERVRPHGHAQSDFSGVHKRNRRSYSERSNRVGHDWSQPSRLRIRLGFSQTAAVLRIRPVSVRDSHAQAAIATIAPWCVSKRCGRACASSNNAWRICRGSL